MSERLRSLAILLLVLVFSACQLTLGKSIPPVPADANVSPPVAAQAGSCTGLCLSLGKASTGGGESDHIGAEATSAIKDFLCSVQTVGVAYFMHQVLACGGMGGDEEGSETGAAARTPWLVSPGRS